MWPSGLGPARDVVEDQERRATARDDAHRAVRTLEHGPLPHGERGGDRTAPLRREIALLGVEPHDAPREAVGAREPIDKLERQLGLADPRKPLDAGRDRHRTSLRQPRLELLEVRRAPDEDLGAPSRHVVERRTGLGRRADGADAIGDGAGEGVDAELPAEGVAAGQERIAGGELGQGEVAPDGQDAHVAAGGLLGEERAQGRSRARTSTSAG
jgi:hypothetical protein